ncbi:accessory gland protein Acp53Ea-like [Drosophila obscura]|uniref:accessory gland protein Acp53Ea-like n=1 Tax=Drosophila obscura TaxID=7282 RepID=UPI000BA18DB1|nr:accessory gland protein Acp53Ea-like [Drosophila obscura]
MNLIKAALLMSAFVVLSMAHDADSSTDSWDKWLECAHLGARASAKLLRGAVPAVRTLYLCVDFEPIRNSESRYLQSLRNLYEFLKSTVYEKHSCLLDPLKGAANVLRPFVERLAKLSCIES